MISIPKSPARCFARVSRIIMKTAVVLAAFSALMALARGTYINSKNRFPPESDAAQSPLASMGGGGSPMGMGMGMGMNRMMLPMLMGGMDMKHFALMNMLGGGGGMGGSRMLPLMAALRGNENMLPILLAAKGGMSNPLAMMAMLGGNDNLMNMLPLMMSSGMGMGGGGGMMRGAGAAGGGAAGPGM
ncbi:hypothetical protein LOTGIDRAFT_239174 [Lottia gigantea]|uniref:Uncharacterized protein n=1 Tax=Lottia gigantea TaxID=225164 RepID=V4AJD2_LOTGI|nr:hypothetical protein LOTGIDRAFT_239174 [Lottia gigantea]ESO97207.1 hypothetical protein LOTGIDRAFT_239174 [Lottia gigantea]